MSQDRNVDEKLLADSITESCSYIQEGIRKLEKHIHKGNELSKTADLQLDIEPHVHQIAVATSSLLRNTKKWANSQLDNSLIDLVYALAKKTRKYSLDYIRTSKASCSNAMDFMTSEEQKNACQQLKKNAACISILTETLKHQLFAYLFESDDFKQTDEAIIRIVTLAHTLATETRKIVRVAARGDPLTMLHKSNAFLDVLNEFIDLIKERTDSNVLLQMTEDLRRKKVNLIHLSQDASHPILANSTDEKKHKNMTQRTQNILQSILELEMEILSTFLFTELSKTQVIIPKKETMMKEEIRSASGPKIPQKPKTRTLTGSRIRSTSSADTPRNKFLPAASQPTMKIPRSKKHKLIPESLRISTPTMQPESPRTSGPSEPRDRSQSVAFESSICSNDATRRSFGVLSESQRIALEATMATSVPVVVSLFSEKFHWFHKEWAKEDPETKQQFMTEMRNILTMLNCDERSTLKKEEIKIMKEQKCESEKPTLLNETNKIPSSFLTRNRNFSTTPPNLKTDEKEDNELQQILVPLSTSVRWYHRSVSLSNILEQQTVKQLREYEISVADRITALCAIVTSKMQEKAIANTQLSEEFPKKMSRLAVEIYHAYSKIISLSTPGSSNQIVHQMALPVNELIMASDTMGNEDGNLIGTLRESNNFSFVKTIVRHLMLHIREKMISLKSLGFQTVYIIRAIDYESQQKISHASTLQLLAITRLLVKTVELLLNQVATFLHIRENFTEDNFALRSRMKEDENESVPYWSYHPTDDESPELGSLNYLIFILTSPVNDLPEGFEIAFLNMYTTFCSSYRFFAKLVERYHVPESAEYSKGAVRELRLRICEILGIWLRHRFFEIDVFTKDKIIVFIKTSLVQDGYQEAERELQAIFAQKATEAARMSNELFLPIPEIQMPKVTSQSLYEEFLSTKEETIAEQLTLHDWNIYRRIQSSELMGQAWNKNKHCASNVLDHIQRLNHVSYWVPSLILWSEKLKERGAVVWKFVRIGQELLKLRNYNTLMGIVAGLNMASILRLKFTLTVLSDVQSKQMEELLDLMGPFKRYKKYKDHIANAALPAIPYLGAYLGDLTFIEDGNPDISEGKIYFGKRLKVSAILEFIAKFQKTPYDFGVSEPLTSYLKELPGLDDDALFHLSLIREPRDAEITDIL